MTDKEYMKNFNSLWERDKHELKTMMYILKEGNKKIDIWYRDKPSDEDEQVLTTEVDND